MTTNNLSADKKLDLLLEKVVGIEQSQKSMQKNITEMKSDINEMKSDITEMKSDVKDLIVTAGDIAIHTGTTADRVTQLEKFTPFKSGAFVA